MRIIRFFFFLIFTTGIVVLLNLKMGQIPPIGKFLDPFEGFWQNAERKEAIINLQANLPLLLERVEVQYDENLIPHIFANNEHDLYFAQGYITAVHRLWQMDFQTRAAAGRISEIIGEQALNYDRGQRRKGMLFAANNAVKELEANDTLSAIVRAYSEGVNAYINSLHPGNFPVEYKLLDYSPEEWTPLKTALLLKYMAGDLSGWDADLENTNALKLFGRETFSFLFPDYFGDMDPVIPEGTDWDFEPTEVKAPGDHTPTDYIPQTLDKPDPGNGSNNWALAAHKTANGKPILANDPHLGLNLPSIWYIMQLNAPGVNVMGATLPGSPAVISGFNENIAWGVTNATRDVRDWFKIEFRDEDRLEYKFENRWLRTQRVVEKINIRYGATFYDTVIYTHHGPVVYDRSFPTENRNQNNIKINFALRWTAHDPSQELMTFHLLNRSKNYNDYVHALSYYTSPAQNFAFAAKDGDIALWIQGKFPARWKEQGKFLMDGSNPLHEWQAFIPTSHNAHIKNPERGFISSANQYPVDTLYPYYVYDANYEFYRNRRINNILRDSVLFTVEDMMKLQNDNFNLKASMILPHMMENLDPSGFNQRQREIYDILKGWNFFNEVPLKAPSVFEVWWDNLYHTLWDEFTNDSIALMKPNSYRTIQILQEHPGHPFMNNQKTTYRETAKDLIRNSFVFAVDSVDRWSQVKNRDFIWGDFKATSTQHLLRIPAFSETNIQIGGHRNIVNATSSRHGASWRMVVELGDPVNAFGIFPGGQSGNPGSRYYNNMIEKWRLGEYIPLLFKSSAAGNNERIIYRQELMPSQVLVFNW
jgi:penicillin G amidase